MGRRALVAPSLGSGTHRGTGGRGDRAFGVDDLAVSRSTLAKDDSRVLAARWIVDSISRGATIGQAGRVSTFLYFPPQTDGRPARYDATTVDSDDDRPDVIVVPTSALERNPERSPVLASVLSHYTRAEQVPAYDAAAANRLVYDWQDEFYLPLAGFGPVLRPGPTLDIYVRR